MGPYRFYEKKGGIMFIFLTSSRVLLACSRSRAKKCVR